MRISAGIYKGRNIKVPSEGTRPTLCKIRQAVFNMLGGDLSGCVFYDVFAGSGIMGIEALSRGAVTVFNDIKREHMNSIRKNLDLIGAAEGSYEISCRDAIDLVTVTADKNGIFYFDPPFGEDGLIRRLISVFEGTRGRLGIFELPVDKKFVLSYIKKEKRYGSIRIVVEDLYE